MQYRQISHNLVWIVFCFLLAACGGGGDSPQYTKINNVDVVNMLVVGNTSSGFTGIGSYIDTKVPLSGIPMFPADVTLNTGIKDFVNKNVNGWLSTQQIFDGANPPAGVTVDNALKKITAISGSMTITWTFSTNGVTRTRSDSGSTYTYSNNSSGVTAVTFYEKNLHGTYNGTATYQRDTVTGEVAKLISAIFDQSHTEVTSDGKSINVNGKVTMGAEDATPGNLTFVGSISVPLPPPLNQVQANVTALNMTYYRGSTTTEPYNMVDVTAITFTSATDYGTVIPPVNSSLPLGIWSGSFTDSPDLNGKLTLSVTSASSITWWGQSSDKTRYYGTSVSYINDNDIKFYDVSTLWGTAKKDSVTQISGAWTLNGRSGTFLLTKQ